MTPLVVSQTTAAGLFLFTARRTTALFASRAITTPCLLRSGIPLRGFCSFAAAAAAHSDSAVAMEDPPDLPLPNSNTAAATIGYQEINVLHYLHTIQSMLVSNQPLQLSRKLSEPNRRPVLRTLLGMTSKPEFDQILRTTRQRLEYAQQADFLQYSLLPVLLEQEHGEQDETPGWEARFEQALEQAATRGRKAFTQLATGRRYQGNLQALVEDVAPHLVTAYQTSTAPISELDVLQQVVTDWSSNTTQISEPISPERIKAARQCCQPEFPPPSNEESTEQWKAEETIDNNVQNGKLNGLACEQACIAYLEQQTENDSNRLVLTNVYINHLSSALKYNNKNNNHNNHHKTGGKRQQRNGVVWTNVDRDYVCSELDAVVVDTHEQTVTQVWEAKSSISPSTLYDAVTKKVAALESLVQDEQAVLQFHHANDDGDDSTTTTTACIQSPMVFGIAGRELLPPLNAIGQLKAIAAARLLDKDVKVAMQSLETGYVLLDRSILENTLHGLIQELEAISNHFHVRVVLVENAQDIL